METGKQARRWQKQGARAAEVKWVTPVSPMCLGSAEWLFSINEGQFCLLKRDL